MRKLMAVVCGFAVVQLLVAPVGATKMSRVPTGGMKIVAVAKGDCAQDQKTIVVTDATTSCSIEISVTPAKRYADVSILEPLSRTSFTYPTWIESDGKVRISPRGKGSAAILKSRNGCVLVSGSSKVFVQVTNAKKFGEGYTASAKSKPITVTYQQSQPEIGACYSIISGS